MAPRYAALLCLGFSLRIGAPPLPCLSEPHSAAADQHVALPLLRQPAQRHPTTGRNRAQLYLHPTTLNHASAEPSTTMGCAAAARPCVTSPTPNIAIPKHNFATHTLPSLRRAYPLVAITYTTSRGETVLCRYCAFHCSAFAGL